METIKRELLSSKLAAALNLSADTVGRYAKMGLIPFEKTPGGHRRFNLGEVRQALASMNSSGVAGLKLPGISKLNPLALGPELNISASAQLRESIRATRTILADEADEEEANYEDRGHGALANLLKNARRIRVSQ